jgi:hypothetical protein
MFLTPIGGVYANTGCSTLHVRNRCTNPVFRRTRADGMLSG